MVRFVSLLTFFALVPLGVQAGPAEDKGLEIAKEAQKRDDGWGDSTSKMVMTLKNRHGQKSVRNIEIRALEVKGDGDKSMSVFNSPRDVRGTALLTFSHKTGDDDQWLYLPALRRVKRIASSNKSGPFMGSEFAYEDLSSQEIEKYTYKYIKDDKLNGVDCFVIERYPVHPKSGYKKQIVWIDKAEYRAHKIDFFDRKNELLKTLNMTDYKKFIGKYWRPLTMNMVNHQTGKSTELLWKDYKFKTGQNEKDFTKTRLKQLL